MVQQVTRGIKISVQTDFEGTFYKNNKTHYAFKYKVTIENRSKDSVQLNTYSSGCLLLSPFGAMYGHYKMIDFSTTKKFDVVIPAFKLSAPFAMN